MRTTTICRLAALLLLVAATLTTLPTAGPIRAQADTGPARTMAAALRPINSMTKDRLRRVWLAGKALGRRSNVLTKVGDSITASGLFLSDAGDGNAVLADHRELAAILTYYRAVRVDRVDGVAHNSLNRHSLAAKASWTAADLLALPGSRTAGTPSPLQLEFEAVNPAVAVIMLGTNDIDHTALEVARDNLDQVIIATLQAGIIPILTTIPDRIDYPGVSARALPFNDAVRELAAMEHVPLIDYWTAMQELPDRGLGPDGVHPTLFTATRGNQASVTFSERALQYGWNVRNYLTLTMLARVKRIVMDDGAPDS